MGGKNKSGQQEVNEYLLSHHIGFCYTLDYVTRIWYGEKVFWKGAVTTQQSIDVNVPNLFGGPKKEGGVVGKIDILLGKLTQVLPHALATRLGRESGLKAPGFRGVTSLFFTGKSSGGFLWQANTPYLKPVWLTGIRAPKGTGLDASKSLLFETVEEADIIPVDEVWKYLEGNKVGQGVTPPNEELYSDPDFDDSSWITGRQPFTNAPHPYPGGFPTTPNTVIQTGKAIWLRKKIAVITPNEPLVMTIFFDNECTMYWNGIKAAFANRFDVGGVYQNVTTLSTPFELVSRSDWQLVIKIPGDLVLETNFVAGYFQDYGTVGDTGNFFAAGLALVQPGGATEEIRANANPAHIIYEVMTNPDFGLGDSPDLFDVDSFNECAQILYDAKLMLSMQWTRQSTVEDFNNEVLKHINGVVFTNPRNGLHTLRLIRGEYDESTLRQLNGENGTITRFSRRVWGQTTNEIAVTWTNPITEKEETVTVQDLANISIQGKIITSSRNYYGVRSRELATELAYRELRLSASPLCTAEMELDRSAWDILPGDVIALSSDDYGLDALPMRVGVVDYGQIGASKIKVSLTEDIFALPISHFEVAPPSPWLPGGTSPTPVFSKLLFTLPAYATGAIASSGLASLPYPNAYIGIAAQAPNSDMYSFDLMSPRTAPNGDINWAGNGTLPFTSKALLNAPVVAEAITVGFPFTSITGEGPTVAGFLLFGGNEETAEFALIQSYDISTGFYTFKRGALDTVPKEWPANTKVWFIAANSFAYDTTVLAAGMTPEYKLLTNSSKGQLRIESAPIVEGLVTERPHLPLRPANFKVGDIGFDTAFISAASSSVSITWANRNRLTEEAIVLDWTASNTTPEVGQTTKLVICDDSMAVIEEIPGLTGVSYTLALSAYAEQPSINILAYSERDGFTSLQAHKIKVIHLPATTKNFVKQGLDTANILSSYVIDVGGYLYSSEDYNLYQTDKITLARTGLIYAFGGLGNDLRGFATDGTYLYTSETGAGAASRAGTIRKVSLDFSTEIRDGYPDIGEGTSVVYCAGSVWVALHSSGVVRRYNPGFLSVIVDIDFSDLLVYELATDGEYVYATNSEGPRNIYKIDPSSNSVVLTFSVAT